MQTYRDVREFHEKFDVKQASVPTVVSADGRSFRMRLIIEEFGELMQALIEGKLPNIAQESVDLLYVVLGTLAVYGIDPQPIWDAVHASNMAKHPGKTALSKPVKGPGWKKPDISKLIDKQSE